MNDQKSERRMTYLDLSELQTELHRLVCIERPSIRARIQEAREYGDLSENEEYITAREDEHRNEVKITQLKQIIADAIVPGSEITADEQLWLQERIDAYRERSDQLWYELGNIRRRQPSPRKDLYRKLVHDAFEESTIMINALTLLLETTTVVDDASPSAP